MASSASAISEPRTSDVAWACVALHLPTAAVQAATANCSVEIASDNFIFARDIPARSMRTEFEFSLVVKEVTVTSFTCEDGMPSIPNQGSNESAERSRWQGSRQFRAPWQR